MKKTLSIFIVLAMLFSTFALFACNTPKTNEEKEENTRMTIDINPSIEFMLDSENKVVSVTALNDDGAILIAGEALIGKTADEATELIISLASDTGYLSEGQENEVKISVSGTSEYAKALANELEASIEEQISELGLQGAVDQIEAATLTEIREMVVNNTSYTEQEVASMTEEELYNALALSRVETALLLTEELRSSYYEAKNHHISFVEREETAKIIDEMGSMYAIMNSIYKASLESYQSIIQSIDNYRYENLVSPDSAYQKQLASLRDAKVRLLEKKNELAKISETDANYKDELDALQAIEEFYDAQLSACESLGQSINDGIDAMLIQLKEIEATLIQIEEGFSDDIKAELTAKASEIEASINLAKDDFFQSFEAQHKADIEGIENELISKKAELKATINASNSNS